MKKGKLRFPVNRGQRLAHAEGCRRAGHKKGKKSKDRFTGFKHPKMSFNRSTGKGGGKGGGGPRKGR